jgi:hypothetical protein
VPAFAVGAQRRPGSQSVVFYRQPKTSPEGAGVFAPATMRPWDFELGDVASPNDGVVRLQRGDERLPNVGDVTPPLFLPARSRPVRAAGDAGRPVAIAGRQNIGLASPLVARRSSAQCCIFNNAVNDPPHATATAGYRAVDQTFVRGRLDYYMNFRNDGVATRISIRTQLEAA